MRDQLPYFRILGALTERPWAITESMMDVMLQIVLDPDRRPDLDALASKLGRPLDNTGGRVERRGATAILGIEGPIFRYANLFTAISGATSLEMAALDLETALADPSVAQVVLNINSPGGEVDGTNAFSKMVREGLDRKPIYAYIDNTGASAAYWIGAAAQKIVAEEGAFVGSIGVTASILDKSAAQERQGLKTYKIISSQSPRKNPSPATEQGRSQLQEQVDTIAQLFIDRVADYRGVSSTIVQSDFGQGGMHPAATALDRGMIDRVQGYEAFLGGLSGSSRSFVSMAATAAKENRMADQPAAPAQQPTAAAPAPPPLPTNTAPLTITTGALNTPVTVIPIAPPASGAAERARIQAILSHPEAEGRRELAQYLALDTDIPADQAAMVLKTSPKAAQPGAQTGPLARAMAQIPNPAVAAGGAATDADSSDAAEVQRVLAFVPKQYKFGAR
jgi:signal peptide peptidase SppA